MTGEGRAGLSFSVLGPIRAWSGPRCELGLGSPQQRAVLAILLLRPRRGVSDAEIIESVWGDEAPQGAGATLQTYVSTLRRTLEPDRPPRAPAQVLVRSGNGYALKIGDDAVDSSVFARCLADADAAIEPVVAREHLTRALDLWQGEPLSGLTGAWAETYRFRLAEQRFSALEARLELDIRLGRHAEVIAELTALTSADPLRERLRQLLMLALYQSGRQAEALGVFDDARRALHDQLGVSPGPELAELHQRILRADVMLSPPESPVVPSPRQPGRAPAQLPADLTDFTGREGLVRDLARSVTESDVVAISGIGGVGKTALAVHVAHAARASFPDGQLYVNLRGSTVDPADPRTVLGNLLRDLGVDEPSVPEELNERSALLRTTLADRRVLIVLDNARDHDQVRPLMPGAVGSVVIVTSRVKLSGLCGARHVDLDILDPAEALDLLSQIIGTARVSAEHGQSMDLVAVCGFLPLAVRIAASRLAARPNWTIATLTARLANERRRLSELRAGDLAVEASFELSYAQLGAEHARAFRLLSIPDAPGRSVQSAAAVLDRDERTTEDLVEQLVDLGLLESPAPGVYTLHDLIKIYARGKAEESETAAERASALRRLLDFTLATARNGYEADNPGNALPASVTPTVSCGLEFSDFHEAREWLVVNASCLFATAKQASSEASTLPYAADLYVAMYIPLAEAEIFHREIRDAAFVIIDAAIRYGDQRSEARARWRLACSHYLMTRLDEALAEARRAVDLADHIGDTYVQAEALTVAGRAAFLQRRFEEGRVFHEEGRSLFAAIGDRSGEAYALGSLSRCLVELRMNEEAVATGERAVAIFRELGTSTWLADSLYVVGDVMRRAGLVGSAITTQRQALAMFREHGVRRWEGLSLFRLATALLDAGQAAEAAEMAGQALPVLRECEENWGKANALTVLGRALDQLGQSDRARACWHDALTIFEQMASPEAEDVRDLLRSAAASCSAPAS